MTDWTPARARRVLAEIFDAPDPTDVEAHDAWTAEADEAELAARILGGMTRSDGLDLAARLDMLGMPEHAERVFASVTTQPGSPSYTRSVSKS